MAKLTMERRGYRVLQASDGHEALEPWERHRDTIQLLFTDMVMPGGMSGPELARRLTAERPDLRVLFTSGHSAEFAGRELSLLPRQAFLPKPASAAEMLEAVRRCLDA
jgi:CheY-like chemotaxis protein